MIQLDIAHITFVGLTNSETKIGLESLHDLVQSDLAWPGHTKSPKNKLSKLTYIRSVITVTDRKKTTHKGI
ncbi:hypothetical protein QQP08_005826 [Theobroma cacao]|nr:hypothetical protein QQP08_005826 [Theobroma cacao]